MTVHYDAYWDAIRQLDAIGPRYQQALGATEANRRAATAASDQAVSTAAAQAAALTRRAEEALASGRGQLDRIDGANRLPARVHPSASNASATDATARLVRRLDELTVSVSNLVTHRDASRRRRLDESAVRERDADAARARAAAEAQRQATERAWNAWQLAKRRAGLTAFSIAGGLALLGVIFAIANVAALAALAFGFAIIVAIVLRGHLLPKGTPPPAPAPRPHYSHDQRS